MQTDFSQQIPNEFKVIQSRFDGGMNLFVDDSLLNDNEYGLAFNLRNRTGILTCIPQISQLTDAPVGLKQGLYGFDEILVLFVAGRAYYKSVDDIGWKPVPGFSMDRTVSRIFCQDVPASTLNFLRVLTGADTILGTNHDPKIRIENIVINGTLKGLVCQDGINQPFIIFPDGTCRRIQSYNQWNQQQREYVPIGKQMAFVNGKLFVASPDGKFIYDSVSGRPLDFVKNIDIQGNKGGDATTTAYVVSYDVITCLAGMNSGQLFVGTSKGGFPVTMDFDYLIFGEPYFDNNQGFRAGVVNQFSFVELVGDYAWVNYRGVRSFNAVNQLQNEGRNSLFSLKVNKLLNQIIQDEDTCAATVFDNYALFAVNTIEGFGILVFDTLSNNWVCIDTGSSLGIKQFALGTSDSRLFAIDSDNVYELYNTAQSFSLATVFSKSVITTDPEVELKLNIARAVFLQGDIDTEVDATEYVNDQRLSTNSQQLSYQEAGITYPADYPVLFDSADKVRNLTFNFSQITKQGWKVALKYSWQDNAGLSHILMKGERLVVSRSITQGII